MDETPQQPPAPDEGTRAPTDDELREAYAAELRRITSTELVLQTAASLINVGAYRLGLAGGDPADRDLEQVRDAIDGVRALLPILERRGDAQQLRPLRDALSQLQLAFARESSAAAPDPAAGDRGTAQAAAEPADAPPPSGSEGAAGSGAGDAQQPPQPGEERGPGPAQRSGRLWVPGNG